ncbi:hypothetical protein BA953_24060 [Vibrio coralliilyticus]|uniref:hypothetical protein n=1 Tax=Vibrio coralliilyticus TaxID=190893 RepID=UPI00081045E9|nr:hypothetical protein [Vibrio coralliilyticus]ANW27195.1 hypothetical protein BA953_24060 [Vibrio coralliilyticus]
MKLSKSALYISVLSGLVSATVFSSTASASEQTIFKDISVSYAAPYDDFEVIGNGPNGNFLPVDLLVDDSGMAVEGYSSMSVAQAIDTVSEVKLVSFGLNSLLEPGESVQWNALEVDPGVTGTYTDANGRYVEVTDCTGSACNTNVNIRMAALKNDFEEGTYTGVVNVEVRNSPK